MNLWGANIGNHTLDSYFDLTFFYFLLSSQLFVMIHLTNVLSKSIALYCIGTYSNDALDNLVLDHDCLFFWVKQVLFL